MCSSIGGDLLSIFSTILGLSRVQYHQEWAVFISPFSSSLALISACSGSADEGSRRFCGVKEETLYQSGRKDCLGRWYVMPTNKLVFGEQVHTMGTHSGGG